MLCCLRNKKGNFLFFFPIYFCQSMEFITLAEQWPPEWQRLISETIVVVPTLSLWPHQIIIMAASQGKEKEPFLLLFFYLVPVTWQSSFKCEFASLKCDILYCIINLVFRIPLIDSFANAEVYTDLLGSFKCILQRNFR